MVCMISLCGKIVFITGASSGIGLRRRLRMQTEGALLLLAARRMDRLEKEQKIVCGNSAQQMST